MAKLCERPGCSEPGAVAYGMITEDLLFWIAPVGDAPDSDARLLCRRHADAMVVPLGWTLDDRRGGEPRLFTTRDSNSDARPNRRTRSPKRSVAAAGEQLELDGTGEIERPARAEIAANDDPPVDEVVGSDDAWTPTFDVDDDLDGLLQVRSPLLARAFRGTGRPRT